LRTRFQVVEGQPVQIIAPTLTLTPVVDLQEIRSIEQETKVKQVATQDSSHPFDLSEDHYCGAPAAVEREGACHALDHASHYLRWLVTESLLPRASSTLPSFLQRESITLPQLPIQYADFALWQRQWLESEGLSTQLAYWKQQLDAAPSAGIAHRLSATCCSNFPWRERNLILPNP